jgi:hypothetical protein
MKKLPVVKLLTLTLSGPTLDFVMLRPSPAGGVARKHVVYVHLRAELPRVLDEMQREPS